MVRPAIIGTLQFSGLFLRRNVSPTRRKQAPTLKIIQFIIDCSFSQMNDLKHVKDSDHNDHESSDHESSRIAPLALAAQVSSNKNEANTGD